MAPGTSESILTRIWEIWARTGTELSYLLSFMRRFIAAAKQLFAVRCCGCGCSDIERLTDAAEKARDLSFSDRSV